LKLKIDKISNALFDEKEVSLSLLRLDLLDTYGGGNKYFKLKHNLAEAQRLGKKSIVTFGGAFSNHIAATAAAGKEIGLSTIGFIRGEKHAVLNPTLQFAVGCGMQLHYLSRAEYQLKNLSHFISSLSKKLHDFYLIPEGGSNLLAVKGCTEIVRFIEDEFDTICCACGTGTTLAGIALSLSANQNAIGFPALKGATFLDDEIHKLVLDSPADYFHTNAFRKNWILESGYHFGGYAKVNEELINFSKSFLKEYGIELDYVYTSKMMYGIFDMIRKDYFPKGTKLVAVHSGGLQGNQGFNLPT
jgi:1-aminocyclopropane-1-carboxylate deaminase